MRTLVRLTFGNLGSAVYLAVVAVISGLVAHDLWFADHEDASFAVLGLVAVAAPTILVPLAAGVVAGDAVLDTNWFFLTAFVVSVLVQSLAIGALVRLATGTTRRRPQPPLHG